ncbi:MAG: hypothetical protein E7665_03050 [Ruminococcaceae bacterium]|nr:hypothetical protein [Oscillospiraceae bacterium]
MKRSAHALARMRTVVFISAGVLAAFSAVCAKVDVNLTYVGLFLAILELSAYFAYSIATAKKNSITEKNFPVLSNITLDFLMQFIYPVVIVDSEGVIIWYNKSFSDNVMSSTVLYNLNLNDVLPEKINMKHLGNDKSDGRFRATLAENSYDVSSYTVSAGKKLYYLTVWQDRSEVTKLENEIKEKNPIVSYISVDNYSDSVSSRQNDYRTVTAKIAMLLQNWASEHNAILRETDRDRYIMIMEEKYLASMMEKKFDILDDVRDLSEDSMDVPVTISIGVAFVDGSFSEKEEVAHTALDLALQRGGDQAVVKTKTAIEFYGGRTKTVQKRTKIRSRIVAGELTSLIKKSGNVLIMGHRYADHDSIGSCVGVARLAEEHCDKINIVVNLNDINLKNIFEKLKGIEKYEDTFVDAATAQELVRPDTLLVICDVNNSAMFESPELYGSVPNVVIIDHHRKTGEFVITPKITYIEPSASSASELVSEILEQALPQGSLLKEEAELLFSGIILDTKQFTRNTGTRTFSAALYLRGEGANPGEAQMLFKTDLKEFLREVKFESNVVIYKNVIAISVYEGLAVPADKIAASKAAERLLAVEGVSASFVLCIVDNAVHISARSSGSVNVQLILEKLHGGGHFDSAGAQLKDMPMKNALSMLKEAIDEYLNND